MPVGKHEFVVSSHFMPEICLAVCWLNTGTALDLCIVAIPNISVPVYLLIGFSAVDPQNFCLNVSFVIVLI